VPVPRGTVWQSGEEASSLCVSESEINDEFYCVKIDNKRESEYLEVQLPVYKM